MADSVSFTLRLMTPAGLVLEEQVSEVRLPGIGGELGFLPGHTRYSGLLGVGVLTFTGSQGAGEQRVVVSGGFCSFDEKGLSVLADSVDRREKFDASLVEKLRTDAETKLTTLSAYEEGWEAERAKLTRAQAMQTLLQ